MQKEMAQTTRGHWKSGKDSCNMCSSGDINIIDTSKPRVSEAGSPTRYLGTGCAR